MSLIQLVLIPSMNPLEPQKVLHRVWLQDAMPKWIILLSDCKLPAFIKPRRCQKVQWKACVLDLVAPPANLDQTLELLASIPTGLQ